MLRKPTLKLLAIETSCDDTAVAIVDCSRRILAERVVHQHSIHASFRGIVPRLASQAHRAVLPSVLSKVLNDAGCKGMHGIDAVAATRGPGIAGSLTVGYEAGRAIAAVHGIPFYPVHHMEGHLLSVRMHENVPFPFLALLISGGHTQIVIAKNLGDYTELGSTLDCTVGQAIDRAAKLLGLEYDVDAGPAASLVKCATCAPDSRLEEFSMPASRYMHNSLDFSFSGLISALERKAQRHLVLPSVLAASFLNACADQLVDRVLRTLKIVCDNMHIHVEHLIVVGGVARNDFLYRKIKNALEGAGIVVMRPTQPSHCTDNAAMIAWTALEHIAGGILPLADDPVCDQWSLQDLKLQLKATDHQSSRPQ